MELRDLIEGSPSLRPPTSGARQPIAGALRFSDGVRPRAVQLQELRSANQTVATERDGIRIGVAPGLECRCPLLRAAEIEQIVASADDTAIHGAGHDGHHLAATDRDHHFVEERQSLARTIEAQERPALPVKGECHEVAAVETLSNAHGLAEQRVCRDDLTVAHTLACQRAKQPSLFHAGLFRAVDQPLRPREPSGRLGLLFGHIREDKRQPERAPCRLQVLSAFEKAGMRARPSLKTRLVFSQQVCDGREAIEVVWFEKCCGICCRQGREGIRPGACVECRSCLLERRCGFHLAIFPQTMRSSQRRTVRRCASPRCRARIDSSTRHMPRRSSFSHVETIGKTLPDVEVTTSWGVPALKVRGTMFVCIASNKSAKSPTRWS